MASDETLNMAVYKLITILYVLARLTNPKPSVVLGFARGADVSGGELSAQLIALLTVQFLPQATSAHDMQAVCWLSQRMQKLQLATALLLLVLVAASTDQLLRGVVLLKILKVAVSHHCQCRRCGPDVEAGTGNIATSRHTAMHHCHQCLLCSILGSLQP